MIETEVHTMMCLVCNQVKTVKGDNAKQHFRRQMLHTYKCKIGRRVKKDLRRKFKAKFTTADILHVHFQPTNNRCEASYKVAYYLGMVGKPYSDGELV